MGRLCTRAERRAFAQGRARAISALRPGLLVAIAHFVHQAVVMVAQDEMFPAVGEIVGERAEHCGHARRIGEGLNVLRHDHKPAARDDRASRKGVVHAGVEPPVRDVHIHAHHVLQLDPLQVRLAGRRVEHHLIEQHHGIGGRAVVLRQPFEGRRRAHLLRRCHVEHGQRGARAVGRAVRIGDRHVIRARVQRPERPE